MSLNIQTNSVIPQNNMAFRSKKNLAKILKEAQQEVRLASKDCEKIAEEFVKDARLEADLISIDENIAKNIMSKMNVQQAKNAYKK